MKTALLLACGFGLNACTHASTCALGDAVSAADSANLDLFGKISYFSNGESLPQGRYRIAYVDGCMKYAGYLPWSVNGRKSGPGWFLGKERGDELVRLPGTVIGDGFPDFSACERANKALPPVEFEFGGGKLGAWLSDRPYSDNLPGEEGRNPRWTLTLLDACK